MCICLIYRWGIYLEQLHVNLWWMHPVGHPNLPVVLYYSSDVVVLYLDSLRCCYRSGYGVVLFIWFFELYFDVCIRQHSLLSAWFCHCWVVKFGLYLSVIMITGQSDRYWSINEAHLNSCKAPALLELWVDIVGLRLVRYFSNNRLVFFCNSRCCEQLTVECFMKFQATCW